MIRFRRTGFCSLGFLSGFVYPLLSSTFALLLLDRGLSIGQGLALSFVVMPYACKPGLVVMYQRYLEEIRPFKARSSWLGWIIVAQAIAGVLLLFLALSDRNFLALSISGLGIGLCAAFSDALIDGARIRAAKTPALASYLLSRYQVGYRLGAGISGAAFIAMSYYANWTAIYAVAACMIWVIAGLVLAGKVGRYGQRSCARHDVVPRTGITACLTMARSFVPSFFFWIAIFRLPDSVVQFARHALLVSQGASRQSVAAAETILGLFGFLAGISLGGIVWERSSVQKSLLVGMVSQLSALMMLFLLELNLFGPSLLLVGFNIFVFDFTSSISGTILVLYLSSFVRPRYEALDYSILVSCTMIGASIIRPLLAYVSYKIDMRWDFAVGASVTVVVLLLSYACIRVMARQHRAWSERPAPMPRGVR